MLTALFAIPQAFARVMQYEAERDAGLFNLGELQRSARAEDANAVAVARRGALEAGLLRSRGTVTLGQQVVGYNAAGIDATSGTAADVQAATRIFAELDAQTARNNAVAAAFGHKEVARKYRLDAAQLQRRYVDGGVLGMGTANDELTLGLATSAFSAAANLGFGGT